MRGGAAVILVQDDGFVGREIDKKVRPGAAPLVDGLVGVPYDKKVPVLGAQALDEVPVVQVAVLGLVHHDVVETGLPLLAGVRETVQDVLGDVHQVVEVQRVVFHLAAHVGGQTRSAAHLVGNHAARQHIGLDVAVEGFFGPDGIQELFHRLFRALEPQLVHGLLGNGLAVFLVQHSEGFGKADAVDFLAQELDAEAVQGAHEVVVVPAVDHGGDAAAHLRRGLVGEGEAQQVGRVDAQDIHQVGVAVRQGLGFARPGARYHADAALCGLYGLPLARIQSLENVCHSTNIVIFLHISPSF